MIFKQLEEVLSRQKTQTRRIHEPRVIVGRTYAAVPKRAAPAPWFAETIAPWHALDPDSNVVRIREPRKYVGDDISATKANKWLATHGAVQARILVEDKYTERLQDISHEDALAEGVNSVNEYRELWDSINKKKVTRWEDNPLVWVVVFKSVDEVHALYCRWAKGQEI